MSLNNKPCHSSTGIWHLLNTGESTRAFHARILTPAQAAPPAVKDSIPPLFQGALRNPDLQPGKQTPHYSEQDRTASAGPKPLIHRIV